MICKYGNFRASTIRWCKQVLKIIIIFFDELEERDEEREDKWTLVEETPKHMLLCTMWECKNISIDATNRTSCNSVKAHAPMHFMGVCKSISTGAPYRAFCAMDSHARISCRIWSLALYGSLRASPLLPHMASSNGAKQALWGRRHALPPYGAVCPHQWPQ
jgi:hypothetical protein